MLCMGRVLMASYLLIHGSWHGAWCWEKVIPLLEHACHCVYAPDLPGHGKDKTPLKAITLDSYVECVSRLLTDMQEPVILVGHSMAGIIISQVAELFPEKIKCLVYVTAFLPKDGESMFKVASQQAPTRFVKMMKAIPEDNAFHFSLNGVKDFAYHLSDEVLVEKLKPLMCVEPFLPSDTPVKLSTENYGRVPRVYIECLQDRAILIQTQRNMRKDIPCRVFTLDCDHSPFYSNPIALVKILTVC